MYTQTAELQRTIPFLMMKQDTHQRNGLKKYQDILDHKHIDSEELAANLFRATQTEAKLRRNGISDKHSANKTHHLEAGQTRLFLMPFQPRRTTVFFILWVFL